MNDSKKRHSHPILELEIKVRSMIANNSIAIDPMSILSWLVEANDAVSYNDALPDNEFRTTREVHSDIVHLLVGLFIHSQRFALVQHKLSTKTHD